MIVLKYKVLFSNWLVLLSFLSFSQEVTSVATYQYILKMDSISMSKFKDNNDLKEKFRRAEILSKSIKPKLIFNDSMSVFQGGEIMDVNDDKISLVIAKGLCKCDEPMYTNIKTKTNYYNFTFSGATNKNLYLVHKKTDENWTLHNESKTINNYLCYKATQEVTVFTGVSNVKNLITAWYCPEIPYAYGPKGYCGLPGLIFELHDKNISFGLETLQLNNTNYKIELPKKGKLISYEDLAGTMTLQKKE